MEEEDSFKLIEKYKSRLNRNNEFKKVFRALQRLNEVDMSIELLQATGIGKVVNSLRKEDGLGDFAKEIVNKWKKLLSNGVKTTDDRQHRNDQESSEYIPGVKEEPIEYDPSGNWELGKANTSSSSTHSYKPAAVKSEPVNSEYDPTQNWQMTKSSHNNSNTEEYVPSASPAKIKQEKVETRHKRKKRENGKVQRKEIQKDAGTDREEELRMMLQKAQEGLKEIEKKKKHKKTEVKVEKESPDGRSMNHGAHSCTTDELEEYDPQSNYQMQSPSPYDPGSPESSSEYEPSSLNRSIEYDPGPSDSNVNYTPSKVKSEPRSPEVNNLGSPQDSENDPGSSRITEDDENDSFDEDEPGAYLLHPQRVSVERLRNKSFDEVKRDEHEEGEQIMEKSPESSFVSSTTLYSRNKSVDSEEGTWGSNVRGVKGRLAEIGELENEDEDERVEKVSHKTPKSDKKDTNFQGEKKKYKKQKEKPSKSQRKIEEQPAKSEKISKKSSEKTHRSKSDVKVNHKESAKRKSTSKDDEPVKKKVKSSEARRSEKKIQPQDAGFLFQDIPEVSKVKKKKKKKSSSAKVAKVPTISKPSQVKLDLHLPQIQTTYRPLPHSNERMREKQAAEDELTDSQAAELHSTRQTKKMLVYSGGGGNFIPEMMSLYDQCMTVLMNNIDAIDVIGGIPYEIIHPVLERCTPEQLYRIEDSNPYLLEDTDVLWEKHALREFKGKNPDEMESWRELFLRLHDEREAKLQNLTQMIQAKEAKKKPLEKKVLLAYVGTNAKAPRNVRRAQEKFGTGLKKSRFSNERPTSTGSAVRQEIVQSRMNVPVGSITAASVAREERFARMKEVKKPKVAPMMAKTLKSIGKFRFKR